MDLKVCLVLFLFAGFAVCLRDASYFVDSVFSSNNFYLFDTENENNTIELPFSEFIVLDYSNVSQSISQGKMKDDVSSYVDADDRLKVKTIKTHYKYLKDSEFDPTVFRGIQKTLGGYIDLPSSLEFMKSSSYNLPYTYEIPTKTSKCLNIQLTFHRFFGLFCHSRYISGARHRFNCKRLWYSFPAHDENGAIVIDECKKQKEFGYEVRPPPSTD